MNRISRLLSHTFETYKVPTKCLTVGFIVILLSLSWPIPANAALFYTGGISIDSLSATIDVTDQADITIEYDLVNHGDSAETVTLTFSPTDAAVLLDESELSNPVAFEPGETKTLTLSYSLTLPMSDYQTILFTPMLLFNDMANSQPVESYNVQLILPEGIKRIIYSSIAYDDTTTQDGSLVLLWEKAGFYPSPLSIAWTTLDVDITATKMATPGSVTTPGEVIQVEVMVENKGETEVANITLRDSFYPGSFEAVAPLDEFELIQVEMSDPHLYWTKEIDNLEPGEKVTCTYSVRVATLGLETRLDALVVSVDGVPVGVYQTMLSSSANSKNDMGHNLLKVDSPPRS